MLSSTGTGIGIDDLRQKECRHAVIRFRNNPEHIIPESFPVPETVLSYPSDRQREWESRLMASFLVSDPSATQQFVIYSKMLNHRRPVSLSAKHAPVDRTSEARQSVSWKEHLLRIL